MNGDFLSYFSKNDNCVLSYILVFIASINQVVEWVSDCFLTPMQINFLWGDEIRFVLDQRAELDFYSASSLKQQSSGWHVAPLGHTVMVPRQPVYTLTP